MKMESYDIWLAIVLVVVAFFLLVNYAFGHDWYDNECCNDKDCSPVDYSEVQEHSDGSITFRHCHFPASSHRIRKSKDGEWHVCIAPLGPDNNSTGYCYCVYKPAPMF